MNWIRRARARARSDRGVAAVEFALVLIPLTLLVFGLIDFGRVYNDQETLTQAARVGARLASVSPTSDIPAAVANAAASVGIAKADVSVCYLQTVTSTSCDTAAGANCSTGDYSVRVIANYNYKFLTLSFATVKIAGKATAPC